MGDNSGQIDFVVAATSGDAEGEEWPDFACAAHDIHEHLLVTDKHYAQVHTRTHAMMSNIDPVMDNLPGVIRIPIVVHVIWNEDKHNISLEQIKSQIASLNRDFQTLNADVDDVPSVWKNLVGNPRLSFFLTQRDEKGNPHQGVVRTRSDLVVFAAEGTELDGKLLPIPMDVSPPWDVHHFLNVWVVPAITNSKKGIIMGYASFPTKPLRGEPNEEVVEQEGKKEGVANQTGKQRDGVVVVYEYFGTNDAINDPDNNLGRTLVHEIGHYLNLPHIFDEKTKEIADTVMGNMTNSGKPLFPKKGELTKGTDNGDMFMNYMDYSDDECLVFFTKDQVERMHKTLLVLRHSLFSSNFGLRIRTHKTDMIAHSDWNYNIFDEGDNKNVLLCVQQFDKRELRIVRVNSADTPGNFGGTVTSGNLVVAPDGAGPFDDYIFCLGPGYLFGVTNVGDKAQIQVWKMGSEQTPLKGLNDPNLPKLPKMNGNWSFLTADWKRDGRVDLVGVKKSDTINKKVEIHVLSGYQEQWKNWVTHKYTALDEMDPGVSAKFLLTDWNGDGTLDFVAIWKPENGKNWFLDILSGASNYREFSIRVQIKPNVLNPDVKYDFVMKNMTGFGRPDLVAIQKSDLPEEIPKIQIIVIGA